MGQKLDVTNVPVGKAHEEFPGGLVGSGVVTTLAWVRSLTWELLCATDRRGGRREGRKEGGEEGRREDTRGHMKGSGVPCSETRPCPCSPMARESAER